jgi:hypothetical protein
MFDVNTKTIVSGAGDLCSMRLYVLDVVRSLNNEDTIDILSTFVSGHPCPRTRAYAHNVLSEINPAEADRLRSTLDPAALAFAGHSLAHGGAFGERATKL